MAVVFHHDGKHLLGGGRDGIRRWRLADGKEVGKQTGMELRAIAASRDHKWVVCGTDEGASVWDANMHERIIEVERTETVSAVDVCPDSARFATGTGWGGYEASVWSITSGERLVGLLEHDNDVTGIKFSPGGDHIATACFDSSIRIFNARNGDLLINIETVSPPTWPNIPLAWSSDTQQIFATSKDRRIRSFAVSTGSQIAESPILDCDQTSIAPAPNGKFIATYAGPSISFLDGSTLSPIVPAIEDSKGIYSIAISPDSSQLAIGQVDGRVTVRNLGTILPDSYGPFHASIRPLSGKPHSVFPVDILH